MEIQQAGRNLEKNKNFFSYYLTQADLSRFGREHVMMDYYLEFVFPRLKVHYIAVNDNEDTEKGLSDFAPFKNLFNEWYCRDTSKKIRAVLKSKGEAGEHLCNNPPYGLKDPDKKSVGLWTRNPQKWCAGFSAYA